MLIENKINGAKDQVLLVHKLMKRLYNKTKHRPFELIPSRIANKIKMGYAYTVPSVLIKLGYLEKLNKGDNGKAGYAWNKTKSKPTLLDAVEVQLYAYLWTKVQVEPQLEKALRNFAVDVDLNSKTGKVTVNNKPMRLFRKRARLPEKTDKVVHAHILSKASIDDIRAELKSRGYAGTLRYEVKEVKEVKI